MHNPFSPEWPPQFIPPEDEMNMLAQGRAWQPTWWGQFYQWMIDRGYMDRSPVPLPSNPADRGDMMYWPPRNISPGMDKGIAGRDMLPNQVQDFLYPPTYRPVPPIRPNLPPKPHAPNEGYFPPIFPDPLPIPKQPPQLPPPKMQPPFPIPSNPAPNQPRPSIPPNQPGMPGIPPKQPKPSEPPPYSPPPPPSDSIQPDPDGKIVKAPAQKTIKPALSSYIKRYDRKI